MPIKVHHGPPGSYKTAGALGDDFLREAKAGRVIVTNVRGLTRERVVEQFPDLPESFDVINVGDKSPADLEKWSKWFHWVPHGAFLFVDEIQMIWPKRWRESDIRALDYPGGVSQAALDNRPATWEEAFEKHRHYNWDMVFTTPNYKKVRDDVKQCAEMAYKHKNLAIIGWSGRYIEAAHMADDEGSYAGQFLSVNRKKVPPYVFKIYDSTATGTVGDTKAGISIFKNPKIVGLLSVLLVAFVLAFYFMRDSMLFGGKKPVSPDASSVAVVSQESPKKAVPVSAGGVSTREAPPVLSGVMPFDGTPFITASVFVKDSWRYVFQSGATVLNSSQLISAGFVVVPRGQCSALLIFEEQRRIVFCGRENLAGSGNV